MPALRILLILLGGLALCITGCRSTIQEPMDPLQTALASNDPRIRKVMDHPAPFELQILFTRIRRTRDSILFTDYSFQANKSRYFYPASTVKFPIAVLALELLNECDSLDRNTRYFVEGDTIVTTFANDIKRVFVVSDNDANNRLMEFLGQDTINMRLVRKEIGPVRISHTLGVHSEERMTKPLLIYINDSTTTPTKPMLNAQPEPLKLSGIKKGIGYYDEDSLVLKPFDFSMKNYYPLESQHGVLKRVIFPEKFPKEQRFGLSEEQRAFLMGAMKMLPREAGYEESEYYDSYCKFFIFGDSRERIPPQINIYNKVGFAYGTLTDCAYIHDTQTGVEFLLTATILVNEDGILNDDVYEYEETGKPFLAALGKVLYQIEFQNRK